MGWLAVGGCSLVAAFALYKFTVSYGTRQNSNHNHTKATVSTIPASEPLSNVEPDDSHERTLPTMAPSISLLDMTEENATPTEETASQSNPINQELKLVLKQPITANPEVTMPPPPPKRSSSPPRLKPPTFGAMPPPSRPLNGSLRPPPSAAASLRVPTTKVLPNTSMAPSSLTLPNRKPSRQVELKPGYSPLDWASLTSRPNNQLRGKDAPENLIRVTPSQLKLQNGRKGKDAWTVYQGRVYNITPYLPFHPGGVGELMRGAGKNSEKLFMETHPWVNWDGMLGACMIGILVSEEEAVAKDNAGGLDDMD